MGKKIVVGPVNRGLKTRHAPFNIDNDSFPVLINAYQWRGRVKRKRGTSFLTRLTRYFDSTSTAYISTAPASLTLDVSDEANLITGYSLETNSELVPGSIVILDSPGGETFTDPASDGVLSGDMGGSGTVNYASGLVNISGGAGDTITAQFSYYPTLPAMGLRDLVLLVNQYSQTLGFDTTYSYRILNTSPYQCYDVSFYKNPPTGTTGYTNYVEKTTVGNVRWNGQDYQNFDSVNYEGALWATNGINVPFTTTNVGMPFRTIETISNLVAGPPATIDVTITGHGLQVGDFLFFNEIVEGDIQGLNFQTGYVTTRIDADNVTVTLPNATLAGAWATVAGIVQYLTTTPDDTKDCIRWFDGDPTNGNATTPVLDGHNGWVNFCPPLSQDNFSIADKPQDKYYLVTARKIIPYKDRLLFIGPVIQTSQGSPLYLKDTVIYSQNGTPYYTASFTGDVDLATTEFNPLLVPDNQIATPTSYFSDQTGFGGFISAGIDEAINTAEKNDDMIIFGFDKKQIRFAYTSNDIVPFQFYQIDNELGSSSPFSSVNLGESVLTRGSRGFIQTTQTQAQRFDDDIPDFVYESQLTDNGTERVVAIRDYINEWAYFSYVSNQSNNVFPDRTMFFNYKDQSWSVFYENYTTYGTFRKVTGYTWATIGDIYSTWSVWNDPWNSGSSTLLQPEVIAGNQQGFIMIRSEGTGEKKSLAIQSFSSSVVTSPNHCLNEGDFIIIRGALGGISSQVNDKVFQISLVETDTFNVTPNLTTDTYLGGGTITRLYRPFIQTKQFPAAWSLSRKTLLGVQQYLLTKTSNAKITLLIYRSQDADDPYNDGPIIPSDDTENTALIYSSVLYTCPESTNLGLTPANTNLNQSGMQSSAQIWHRKNTPVVGDTVQIAFTLSDDQMRDENQIDQFAEIELYGFILDVSPSQLLS